MGLHSKILGEEVGAPYLFKDTVRRLALSDQIKVRLVRNTEAGMVYFDMPSAFTLDRKDVNTVLGKYLDRIRKGIFIGTSLAVTPQDVLEFAQTARIMALLAEWLVQTNDEVLTWA